MIKDKLQGTLMLGVVICMIGFVMLFFSVNFGMSFADELLIKQGGADSNTYNIIVKSYIKNFLVAGGILFAIGLFIISVIYYKL